MNPQILRLSGVAMALLAILIAATTYWQTWARADLAAKQDNAIQRVAEFSIRRGTIESGGRLLAGNRRRVVDGQALYFRRYPLGPLTAHVVGYSTASRARTGLEKSLNDYLTASNQSLSTFVDRSLDQLRGKPIRGNDVRLTLNLRAQRVALEALGTRCGAVVALDPRNGAVKVLASSPSYDPNLVERRFSAIGRIRADCSPASPLLDRATAGLYPPGSTFKLVTASAALSSGKFTPESPFTDPGYCVEYGKPVYNFGLESGGPEVFGRVTLAEGLVHSINSVYCNIGKQLGAIPILRQAERFGFYRLPPLETPEEERRPSGLYDARRKPFFPRRETQVDPGRIAFGQERLLVTPLQMAMVAATLGNGGVEMRPFVVSRIVSPGGRTIVRAKPHRMGRPVSPQVAAAIKAMMVDVVRRGTGTAAQVPGLLVGGKTGTAETGVSHRNTTWFVCFAGPDDGSPPRVAVAVVLEGQSSTGGATAAPIARQVIETLLLRSGNP